MRATVVIAVSAAAAFAGLCTTPSTVEPASTGPVALTAQATPLRADAGDYRRGFRDGYREGYRDGFRDGRDSCDPHRRYGAQPFRPGDYDHGYLEGYDRGYRAGFDSGCHHHHFPR